MKMVVPGCDRNGQILTSDNGQLNKASIRFVSNSGQREHDRLVVPKTIEINHLATSPPEFTSIIGYRSSTFWSFLYFALCILSAGILCILTSWWPQLYSYIARVQVKSLLDASSVLVHDTNGEVTDCLILYTMSVRSFEYKKQRYLYSAKIGSFERVTSILLELCGSASQRLPTGLSTVLAAERMAINGPNSMEMASTSLPTLLFEKLVHPFYLFQLISVALWLEEAYYTYALAILAMSLTSVIYEVYTQVQNTKQMQALVACDVHAQVKRDGNVLTLAAADLVVGEEHVAPADMVLLSGECMADESSLTGEAIPVSKQPVLDMKLSVQDVHKSSLVYNGSVILRVQGEVWAVVVRTGFSTSKGDLFRHILFPDTIPFQMVTDSYRYLVALSIVAGLASIQRIYDGIQAHSSFGDLIISVFDLISTTIPAALPMILTVGVGFSLTRLQSERICCIDAQKINVAGHLNCFCFDKTGTLTSDRLHFKGIDVCDSANPKSIDIEYALASCHGLSVVDGNLSGYSLELDMFASTNYSLLPSHELVKENEVTLRYIRRFPFDATLQRSSVVVHAVDENQLCRVFVKGSPEAISEVCQASSVPSDYHARVQLYAARGLYCMGLATKFQSLSDTSTDRARLENDLTFLGFLLFENPIKPESYGVIRALHDARIDIRIITGDNALTAMHVARSLEMRLSPSMIYMDVLSDRGLMYQLYPTSSATWLPTGDLSTLLELDFDFSITGAALEAVRRSVVSPLVTRLVQKTKIFARIKPQLKTWIIQELMETGLFVGMTGDGTNDCGALKAAHVGLALSDAEASIVAPFTSRDKDIKDVVTLIREGRCALTTSLLSFKYMVMYSVVETTIVAVLNHIQATMSNNQYLFDDMFVVLGISVLMLQTPPARRLSKMRPPHSLFAPSILWSVAGQTFCFILFFFAILAVAKRQPWFCSLPDVAAGLKDCYPYQPNESDDMTVHGYEVSIVWLMAHWQYIVLAAAFNQRDPFRLSAKHNRPFVLYTVGMAMIMLFILLWPGNYFSVNWFDLITPLPLSFCWFMGGGFALNLILSITIEAGIQKIAREHSITLGSHIKP